MCNAWNHPLNCTCGWGGEGYFKANGSFFYEFIGEYEGYVNPNALCPVCREQIYFVSFSNGGRAFFDELGPPWPKHPCTDRSSSPPPSYFPDYRYSDEDDLSHIAWYLDGWKPVQILHFASIDPKYLRVHYKLHDKNYTLYLKKSKSLTFSNQVRAEQCAKGTVTISLDVLTHLYCISNRTPKLSLLLPSGNSLGIHCYESLAAARVSTESSEPDMTSFIGEASGNRVRIVKKVTDG